MTLAKIRKNVVRLFLAASVVLLLAGPPAITPTHAGDCPPPPGETC